MSDTNHFTASQIARAAGISRQAASEGLASVPSTGQVMVAGQAVTIWSFAVIPTDWQAEIIKRAVRRGFDNGEVWMRTLPLATWSPPVPWDKVPEKHRMKAGNLQLALSRPLELWSGQGLRGSDLEASGVQHYCEAFGYSLSPRHWRKLFNRTIERDSGEENWERPELYLDDRAFQAPAPRREDVRAEYVHRGLGETLKTLLENRQAPTPRDRQFLWDAVFQHYEVLTGALPDSPVGNRERKRIKNSLVRYLFKAFPAGMLCTGLDSLRRRFDEKRLQWIEKGRSPDALEDRRAIDSGNFRKADFSQDFKLIRNMAITLDGSVSLAYRMLREQGRLSQAFCDFYHFDPRADKSAVPQAVRDAVTPEVEMCLPIRKGPWQARMRGPYIPRDWGDVNPGDWFSADDVTWNHYFKDQLPDGRWQIMRGECLVMTDLKTGYPLDFLLITGKYNSEHVRSLTLKVHDRVGLPRLGFYFERGVWSSRLVTGDSRQGNPVHRRETENGLCSAELKLQIRHATTPRAKPIEGIFRIVQERMRCIPNFVGFNERTENFERIQDLIARANRGDSAALDKFPTALCWRSQIKEVLNEFANEPQNGKMLEGKSPAEMFGDEVRTHPLRKLADNTRYILSTHQKKIRVRPEGIVLTIRGKRLVYFNEHTGPLIGREVLAFYNIEMPELLTVCDLHRQNYFSVQRVELPAMSATSQQLEDVRLRRNAHMAPAKAIFGELKHDVVSTITRDNEQDAQSQALGRFHNQEMAKDRAAQSAQTRKMNQIREEAAREGIVVSPNVNVRNPDRVLTGIKRRKFYMERILEDEAAAEKTGEQQ